jgi:macrolide-specific efflux system membrane fusion protein
MVEITPTLQPTKVESNRAQMARLQADLADQRAQLEFAQLQFKRQTQLKAQNATREEAFESARMSASSASARVDAITAQIRELEATAKIDEEARQRTMVKAPLSGTVVQLAARPGQMVSAAQPAVALLRIADLSQMTVAARVAENDVTRLRPGMAASFTTPGYPGKRWSGKLRQVIPVPVDGTGEQGKQAFYIVLFEVKNQDHELMSGMSAQVQFVVAQARDALLLPVNGLGAPDEDGLYSVNVLDASRHVSSRRVKVGLRTSQQAQILSGLAAGDKVLVGAVPNELLGAGRAGAWNEAAPGIGHLRQTNDASRFETDIRKQAGRIVSGDRPGLRLGGRLRQPRPDRGGAAQGRLARRLDGRETPEHQEWPDKNWWQRFRQP